MKSKKYKMNFDDNINIEFDKYYKDDLWTTETLTLVPIEPISYPEPYIIKWIG